MEYLHNLPILTHPDDVTPGFSTYADSTVIGPGHGDDIELVPNAPQPQRMACARLVTAARWCARSARRPGPAAGHWPVPTGAADPRDRKAQTDITTSRSAFLLIGQVRSRPAPTIGRSSTFFAPALCARSLASCKSRRSGRRRHLVAFVLQTSAASVLARGRYAGGDDQSWRPRRSGQRDLALPYRRVRTVGSYHHGLIGSFTLPGVVVRYANPDSIALWIG